MPIVGLTDGQPRLFRLGTLRKGEAKTEKNRPGRNLDHFRFDPVAGEEQLGDVFAAEHPTGNDIVVYLPYRSAAENWSAFREEWTASQLAHRCDGVSVWEYDQFGVLHATQTPCPYAHLDESARKCKQVGRLSVMIPTLAREGYIGIVTVVTSSKWDILNISNALTGYEFITGGNLTGSPYVLSRRPSEISKPMPDGRRVRSTEHLIVLRPERDWMLQRQIAAQTVPDRPRLVDNTMEIVFENDDQSQDSIIIDAEAEFEGDMVVCEREACGVLVRAEAARTVRSRTGSVFCKEHYIEWARSQGAP